MRPTFLGLAALWLALPAAASQERAAEQQRIADSIDASLERAWSEMGIAPAAPADDATWLRRLSIDLHGTIPSPREVERFLQSTSPDKRARKIDDYLADERFAANLSFEWTRLLLGPAGKDTERTQQWLRPWLEEQFAAGVPFKDLARELITASGADRRPDAYAFPLAYRESLETFSALVARAFLGLQIQCAQCHDHPDDKWTQSDYRGFTGFFLGMHGDFYVKMGGSPVFRVLDMTPEDSLRERLTKIASKPLSPSPGSMEMGGNAAGAGVRELNKLLRSTRPGTHPLAPVMGDPETYAATLEKLPADARDVIQLYAERMEIYRDARFLDGKPYDHPDESTRRGALASWIVDPKNPWFGRAITNRIWSQLFGKGLTEPIDDLSGSKDRVLPEVLDFVAEAFVANGTDLRDLYGALVRTKAYALGNSLNEDPDARAHEERWFAAHPMRPFTAEQVLHSLLAALTANEPRASRSEGPETERELSGVLGRFRTYFSDDEGGGGDTFAASIPQALFLINGRYTNHYVRSGRSGPVESLVGAMEPGTPWLDRLYLTTLGRLPTAAERVEIDGIVAGAQGSPGDVVEDLCWALLNSTEFHTNR